MHACTLQFLVMLYNIGVAESGKSVTLQQFSEWTRTDTPTMRFRLQKLVELGYVQFMQGNDKFHLALDGIRKCEHSKRERTNALRQLAELKDQLSRGAITEEEYDLKEKELRKKAWDPT